MKGASMMEEELRQFLKTQGWNLARKKRSGKEYFYAKKWRRGDAYIGPVSKVETITEDHVLEKLAKAL
jgi:hypothetical protein